MKTIFFTTAAALIAIANPANAQILGGSGGGILGGGARSEEHTSELQSPC